MFRAMPAYLERSKRHSLTTLETAIAIRDLKIASCFNSFDTFSNKPIVHTHKWVGDETNQVDGVIATEIKIDEDKKALVSDLIFYNPDLIEAIESGKDVELSPGFTGDILEESGRFDGQSYDYKQLVKVANHLAVVENGRAGKDLKIQDSKEKINGAKKMAKQTPWAKFADSLNNLKG